MAILQGTNLRQSALGGAGRQLGPSSRKHSKESVTLEQASAWMLEAMADRMNADREEADALAARAAAITCSRRGADLPFRSDLPELGDA